jgi:protein-tyrosine phosphatase
MVDFVGADHAFGDLLRAIAGNAGAVVFHCTEGKDRTGWGTAVLLSLLGVPRATVEADFLLSNEELGDPKAVELSWLRAAFAEVDHLYGSVDAYARQGLGLDDVAINALVINSAVPGQCRC